MRISYAPSKCRSITVRDELSTNSQPVFSAKESKYEKQKRAGTYRSRFCYHRERRRRTSSCVDTAHCSRR